MEQRSQKEGESPNSQQTGWLRNVSTMLFSPIKDVISADHSSPLSVGRTMLSWDTNDAAYKDLHDDAGIGHVLSYDSDDCSLDKNGIPSAGNATMRFLDCCSTIQETLSSSMSFTMILSVLGLCFATMLLAVPLTVAALLQFSPVMWPWVYSFLTFSYASGFSILCGACKIVKCLCRAVLAIVHYLTEPNDTLEWEVEVESDCTVYKYHGTLESRRTTVAHKESYLDIMLESWKKCIVATVAVFATIFMYMYGCFFISKFLWSAVVLGGAAASVTTAVASLGCSMFC